MTRRHQGHTSGCPACSVQTGPYIVTVKRPLESVAAKVMAGPPPTGSVSRRAVAMLDDAVLDLGEPDGVSRYWLIVTDHPADHPDVHAAAVHARATGSVGCTYNEARVTRLLGEPLPESGGTVGPLPDGTVIEVEPITEHVLGLAIGREDPWWDRLPVSQKCAAYNRAQADG